MRPVGKLLSSSAAGKLLAIRPVLRKTFPAAAAVATESAEATRGTSATQAPTIAPTAPAFAPIAPATTAFATSAALDATLAATTKDDP